MNILEQLRAAKRAGLPAKISTHGELAMGEEFEFFSRKPLKVGATIDLRVQGGSWYGMAKIVKAEAGTFGRGG